MHRPCIRTPQVGVHVFSNLDFGAILAQQHAACAHSHPVDEVRRSLSPWLVNLTLVRHTRHPSLNMKCFNRYRPDRPKAERETRLQHHLAQWRHMSSCLQMILSNEATTGQKYDLILKVGDGGAAHRSFECMHAWAHFAHTRLHLDLQRRRTHAHASDGCI